MRSPSPAFSLSTRTPIGGATAFPGSPRLRRRLRNLIKRWLRRGHWPFRIASALGLGCLLVVPRPTLADPVHAGPIFDDFDLTLSSGHRTEIAGPFYYHEQEETEQIWAVPPLLSYTRDPATERVEFNFVYPVVSYIRYGGQYRLQFFQLLSFAGGETQTETTRRRITLFPLYFQQRSSDPSQNYTAYGPFYGHLKNRLMRDEIFYVMFPLYSETKKGGVVTDNYLYPVFHLRHGPGLSGWQFWPLVGHEHKDITTKTNHFGDVEKVGGHDNLFVLWPVFFNQHAGIGTENPQWQQGVIPAYSLLRSPQRDSTTVLWPFFSHINDREKKYREWDAPWPLVVMARGEGKYTTRVWPFYSHAYNSNIQSDWYLWPVYKYKRIHSDPLDRQRTRILFFLYDDVTEKNTENGSFRRRTDLWPFFVRHRDLNGSTRLQVLAVLDPFVPENHNVEREYAPVYSFWRSEHNAKTGATSQSLLWNLYRHQSTTNSTQYSALFGLVQYRSKPEGKSLRLFYIPLLR